MINANDHVGQRDILFITFDTLRYDVASRAMEKGQTPFLQTLLPNGVWEERYTPGSFTYAAHHAFFAGFLPTPISPTPHERLFALKFAGSETIGKRTCVFDAPDILSGFKALHYRSLCIGGVGFFNKQTPLGNVLPSLFDESEWREEFGVTCKQSPINQLHYASQYIKRTPLEDRIFLFLNLSAMHQPNCHYVEGARVDTPATQGAALAAVDQALQRHAGDFENRKWLCVFTSDHGTSYGENGYVGHRHAHEKVWRVPYAEFLWN